MALTKYTSYYNKIREDLTEIKNKNEYSNLSMAFAHWFMDKYFDLEEQDIGEAIIDGNGDNGIDAIIPDYENHLLTVMQFKFPNDANSFNKEINQADILKTLHGFDILIGNDEDSRSNAAFKRYKEELNDKDIYYFKLLFVCFNKGVVDNIEILTTYADNFKKETGSSLEIDFYDKEKISNIYEKINRKNSIELNLKYKQMQQANDVPEKNISSYIGVVNGKQLIEAVGEKLVVIFDENIRLYELKSKVNDTIKKTASEVDIADMFYFYNNGVVFICDQCDVSPNSLTARLKGASIVNGCQTVTSLADVYNQGILQDTVDILVRVIVISDYEQRAKITQYLNSQNAIKDSYFISNHTIVRGLQEELKGIGYYLERQINESYYKNHYGQIISSELKVIKLEKAIQYYVGYWLNNLAASAKSGKGALFDENKIEEILSDINAKKVVEAHESYEKISVICTKYRKTRRNPGNAEFANFMNIDNQDLQKNIEQYLFINTGDIIILNTVKNLKQKYNIEDIDSAIRVAIKIICKEIAINFADSPSAGLTKNTKFFNSVQKRIDTLEKADYEEYIN